MACVQVLDNSRDLVKNQVLVYISRVAKVQRCNVHISTHVRLITQSWRVAVSHRGAVIRSQLRTSHSTCVDKSPALQTVTPLGYTVRYPLSPFVALHAVPWCPYRSNRHFRHPKKVTRIVDENDRVGWYSFAPNMSSSISAVAGLLYPTDICLAL